MKQPTRKKVIGHPPCQVSESTAAAQKPGRSDLPPDSEQQMDVPSTYRPAPPGRCSFPGCSLREKHAGLHLADPDLPEKRKRQPQCFAQSSKPRTMRVPRPLFTSSSHIPELRFADTAPFGVVWPPDAAARFGSSLCCARSVKMSVPLHRLTEDLIQCPKHLPWGSARSQILSLSRKKMM